MCLFLEGKWHTPYDECLADIAVEESGLHVSFVMGLQWVCGRPVLKKAVEQPNLVANLRKAVEDRGCGGG